MASFIYFYSKFTEEFLLLSAAGIFTLLSLYCYHWVVKRRLLGAARNQVPAGMVKVYLNQLINEAQFVRTQLFGLIAGAEKMDMPAARFQASDFGINPAPAPSSGDAGGGIPQDLADRLKALEGQLADKESMVVNINVEKTKLLEEVENLKKNQASVQNTSSAGGNEELLKKLKNLEERLEEYSLFEDDLANLKRLQQENTQLKKRVAEMGGGAGIQGGVTTSVQTPAVSASPEAAAEPSVGLDQNAIDKLMNGVPATPHTPTPSAPAEPIVAAAPEPVASIAPAAKADEFEKLVDSVETSLEQPAASAAPVEAAAAPAADQPSDPAASKTDEELLKEFENLLNS